MDAQLYDIDQWRYHLARHLGMWRIDFSHSCFVEQCDSPDVGNIIQFKPGMFACRKSGRYHFCKKHTPCPFTRKYIGGTVNEAYCCIYSRAEAFRDFAPQDYYFEEDYLREHSLVSVPWFDNDNKVGHQKKHAKKTAVTTEEQTRLVHDFARRTRQSIVSDPWRRRHIFTYPTFDHDYHDKMITYGTPTNRSRCHWIELTGTWPPFMDTKLEGRCLYRVQYENYVSGACVHTECDYADTFYAEEIYASMAAPSTKVDDANVVTVPHIPVVCADYYWDDRLFEYGKIISDRLPSILDAFDDDTIEEEEEEEDAANNNNIRIHTNNVYTPQIHRRLVPVILLGGDDDNDNVGGGGGRQGGGNMGSLPMTSRESLEWALKLVRGDLESRIAWDYSSIEQGMEHVVRMLVRRVFRLPPEKVGDPVIKGAARRALLFYLIAMLSRVTTTERFLKKCESKSLFVGRWRQSSGDDKELLTTVAEAALAATANAHLPYWEYDPILTAALCPNVESHKMFQRDTRLVRAIAYDPLAGLHPCIISDTWAMLHHHPS